jgi:menaquinone-dependent protoporphyrinogen oxidase
VSVCLAVLQREPKVERDLAAIVDHFLTSTGWRPAITKQVAGALAYSRYNWLKRWAMIRIVRKAGGDTDTSRDYEYTELGGCPELRRGVRSIAARASGGIATTRQVRWGRREGPTRIV